MRHYQWGRALVALVCVVGALALTSCAELQRRDLRTAASDYLDDEKQAEYGMQITRYGNDARTLLGGPYTEQSNPLRPAKIVDYQITNVFLEGKTARVDFKATVEVESAPGSSGFYGLVKPGVYELSLQYVDQAGRWSVDEVTSRAAWVAKIKGQQYADLWLQQLQVAAQTRR